MAIGEDLRAERVTSNQQYRGRGRASCPSSGSGGPGHAAIPVLRVRTLGSFEVWRGPGMIPSTRWKQRKVAALFKCLIGAPGQQLPRERLLDLLWPDADSDAGAGNLSIALHRLRRVLQDSASGESYVVAERNLLVLRPAGKMPPPPDWLDADAFEDAARRSLEAADPAMCRAALALYSGDYLPGDLYEDWSVARREALHLRYLEVLLRLADLAGAQGEVAEAERSLRTVLGLDPCHEEAAARLMRLLAAAGRRTEALRAYQELAVTLTRELGASPSDDLETLRLQIMDRQAAPVDGSQSPKARGPVPSDQPAAPTDKLRRQSARAGRASPPPGRDKTAHAHRSRRLRQDAPGPAGGRRVGGCLS